MYKIFRKLRPLTHTHVIGSSGTGKSKFLESMMRNDVLKGRGFTLVDYHGSLFRDVLKYLAFIRTRKPIVILDPSNPDWVTGFNPFMNSGADLPTTVSRRISAVTKPWGMKNTDETPELERVCRMLFYVAALLELPLPVAALLLRYPKKELRQYVISRIPDSYMREQWNELDHARTLREWREQTRSVNNRIARFVSLTSINRHMGMKANNISISDILDRDAILLVNLGASDYLDRPAARIFAALLLSEFFEAAMRRIDQNPKPYGLYLDEFQEFMTDDLASMLDQVRKGGLHLVLAHQRMGHLDEDSGIRDAILTNAKLRVIFGGLPFNTAAFLAQEMFLDQINRRHIKASYYRIAAVQKEETRKAIAEGKSKSFGWSRSSGSSDSSGWSVGRGDHHSRYEPEERDPSGDTRGSSNSYQDTGNSGTFSSLSEDNHLTDSRTVTTSTVFKPYYFREKCSDVEWGREEKVSRFAQLLMDQHQRHCFVRPGVGHARSFIVPLLREFNFSRTRLGAYQDELYGREGGVRGPEADARLLESEKEFLALAKGSVTNMRRRRS